MQLGTMSCDPFSGSVASDSCKAPGSFSPSFIPMGFGLMNGDPAAGYVSCDLTKEMGTKRVLAQGCLGVIASAD
eukprot:4879923-Pyramimonas_sp.AAC.1